MRSARRPSRPRRPSCSSGSTTSPASTTTGSSAPCSGSSGRRCARATTRSTRTASRCRTSPSSSTRTRCRTCPSPVPMFEIWVYSPRVEGVHLRFGKVARGGLRWSDRREDFRTEILGLVKAQMVKNAVIVPTGSKGGFYPKALPDPSVDRDAWLAEGVASYRTFISGLLDVTDNLVSGEVVPPERRRAARRRRHLPRRRGRQGHRDLLRHRQRPGPGARLLARRRVRVGRLGGLRPQGHGHHRPRRVGVGQAALPRAGPRHPDAGLHGGRRRRHERRRLRQRDAPVRAHPARRGLRPPARLRRPGPGRRDVVRRAARGCSRCRAPPGPTTTPRCSARAAACGRARPSRCRSARRCAAPSGCPTTTTSLTPAELIHAILLAPVDLLWNGGIGTYVKAASESQADVGRPRQRRHPRRRPGAAGAGRRRGRQPRPDPAGPDRGGQGGCAGQHRRHRQLGRCRHQRPRGQPQDPPRPGWSARAT